MPGTGKNHVMFRTRAARGLIHGRPSREAKSGYGNSSWPSLRPHWNLGGRLPAANLLASFRLSHMIAVKWLPIHSGHFLEELAAGMSTQAAILARADGTMLLRLSGCRQALRNLLKVEQERGQNFLRVAEAVGTVYPR